MPKGKQYNVNMRLVAKQANVSIATVSRYINNPEKLSENMREKVGKAMNDLGYIPNELAKAVLSGVSKVIGVVVPSVTNPFFAELATSIEQKARLEGDAILLMNTHDDAEIEKASVSTLLSYRVAAIIVCRSQNESIYENIDVPVICFENPVSNCQAIVRVDNEQGGFIAFNHLVDIGCKRILHIKGPGTFEATEERYRGFIRGFEALDEKERPETDIYQMSRDFVADYSDTELDSIPNLASYDGVFAFNDIIAASLLRVLNRRGIDVPEQMRVIGFDGSYYSQMTAPPLSTVSQHVDQISTYCIEAVSRFRNEIKEDKVSQRLTFTVPTELIIRDSTKIGDDPVKGLKYIGGR